MPRRRLAVLLPALLPLLLVMSCAGTEPRTHSDDASSPPTTLDAAFLARAEKACRPYATYNSGHFLQVAGFNRYAPDVALLPLVAEHVSRNPSYRTLVSDLEALGRPDGGREAWGAVMDDVAAGEELVRKQIVSARNGDGAGFVTYVERVELNIKTLQRDMQKLGLPGGSPCWGAQLDPLANRPGGY